jgi:hypothetical protein
MILFYGNPLTPHVGCIEMAVIIAVVTKNMRMSRRWKAELVSYGILLQLSPRITHVMLLKPDRLVVYQVFPESVQHLVLSSKSRSYQTVHRNRSYE